MRGEINHMDAEAASVRGIIVIAKNGWLLPIPPVVWVMKGTGLLGTPHWPFSMAPDGCAPMGLKYRVKLRAKDSLIW